MGLMKQLSVGAQDDLRSAIKDRLSAGYARGGSGNTGSGAENSASDELGKEGFLEKNLGVPMVVVGCKADSLQSETFEQQQRLHFIQQSLRRFCLKCEMLRCFEAGILSKGYVSCNDETRSQVG